jgi:hypothetical protein
MRHYWLETCQLEDGHKHIWIAANEVWTAAILLLPRGRKNSAPTQLWSFSIGSTRLLVMKVARLALEVLLSKQLFGLE